MTLQPSAARQRRSPLRAVATSPAALSVMPAAADAPLGDATPGASTAMWAPNNSANNHWAIASV